MLNKAAGLTAVKVGKAAADRHMDSNGLRLIVRETGARFWLFRYTMPARPARWALAQQAAIRRTTFEEAVERLMVANRAGLGRG